MPDPVGTRPPRDWAPGLYILVFDPDPDGNEQVDVAPAGEQLAALVAGQFDVILGVGPAWRTGGSAALPEGLATEAYVDEALQPILDALDGIMNP